MKGGGGGVCLFVFVFLYCLSLGLLNFLETVPRMFLFATGDGCVCGLPAAAGLASFSAADRRETQSFGIRRRGCGCSCGLGPRFWDRPVPNWMGPG